jgi:hypothetical protein
MGFFMTKNEVMAIESEFDVFVERTYALVNKDEKVLTILVKDGMCRIEISNVSKDESHEFIIDRHQLDLICKGILSGE